MSERICSVSYCDLPVRCRALCGGHYQQAKSGRPLRPLRSQTSLTDRLWQDVDRSDPDGCWEWPRSRSKAGYGYTKNENHKTVYAHRVSWEITYGPIPDGLCVCHRCDNPPCVNPAHFFLGTYLDNARDRQAKGRSRRVGNRNPLRGEASPSAKLTAEQVTEIRRAWAAPHGPRSGLGKRLATEYGVSHRLISAIVLQKVWKSIP